MGFEAQSLAAPVVLLSSLSVSEHPPDSHGQTRKISNAVRPILFVAFTSSTPGLLLLQFSNNSITCLVSRIHKTDLEYGKL